MFVLTPFVIWVQPFFHLLPFSAGQFFIPIIFFCCSLSCFLPLHEPSLLSNSSASSTFLFFLSSFVVSLLLVFALLLSSLPSQFFLLFIFLSTVPFFSSLHFIYFPFPCSCPLCRLNLFFFFIFLFTVAFSFASFYILPVSLLLVSPFPVCPLCLLNLSFFSSFFSASLYTFPSLSFRYIYLSIFITHSPVHEQNMWVLLYALVSVFCCNIFLSLGIAGYYFY